jgi:hypothetical protein
MAVEVQWRVGQSVLIEPARRTGARENKSLPIVVRGGRFGNLLIGARPVRPLAAPLAPSDHGPDALSRQQDHAMPCIPDKCRLLHGPYRPPTCSLGKRLRCRIRGRVVVKRISAGPISWPQTIVGRARAFRLVGLQDRSRRRLVAVLRPLRDEYPRNRRAAPLFPCDAATGV